MVISRIHNGAYRYLEISKDDLNLRINEHGNRSAPLVFGRRAGLFKYRMSILCACGHMCRTGYSERCCRCSNTPSCIIGRQHGT